MSLWPIQSPRCSGKCTATRRLSLPPHPFSCLLFAAHLSLFTVSIFFAPLSYSSLSFTPPLGFFVSILSCLLSFPSLFFFQLIPLSSTPICLLLMNHVTGAKRCWVTHIFTATQEGQQGERHLQLAQLRLALHGWWRSAGRAGIMPHPSEALGLGSLPAEQTAGAMTGD